MHPRVLLLDNHDSFTFNLVQALRGLGAAVTVEPNDTLTLEAARALAPTHLVLSPGPGRPEEAGILPALLADFRGRTPVLGVCLGHQAIGMAHGGRVERARRPVHGKASRVYHDGRGLFRGLPNPFPAGRYHSLCVSEEGLDPVLEVSAWTTDGEIMGLRHRELALEGVQFHPESVLTPRGARILGNFLALVDARRTDEVRP